MRNKFEISSKYKPAGDQPKAIQQLVEGVKRGDDTQTLLGITGSGKTFTIANVIEQVQKQYGSDAVKILQLFTSLNQSGKEKAVSNLEDLTAIEKYIK